MSASSISRVRRVAVTGDHSLGYFIHRTRVQKLYRSFLRVCQTPEERLQVRAEFKTNRLGDAAVIKQAEAILKQLQLARGYGALSSDRQVMRPAQVKTIPSHGPKVSITSPGQAVDNQDADDDPTKVEKIEWPWQRKGDKHD